MERYQRHRYALALPFLLFGVLALLGGVLNGATASGRIVDDYTGDPVKDAALSVGLRKTWSAEDGSYRLENVPRTTSIRVDAGGYFRTAAPPDAGDIRLGPNSITAQVNVEGADPVVGVPGAQFRQEVRVLATANATGGANITPHPGRDAKVTVCAKGFRTKEVTVRGVTLVVLLAKDPTGDCPPLPTPTPNPNATPTPPPTPAPTPGTARDPLALTESVTPIASGEQPYATRAMRLVLLALTIVLSTFPVVLAGVPSDGEYLYAKVVVFLGDIPAFLLAAAAAPLVVRRLRAGAALDGATVWTVLIFVLLAAFAVHPSMEGVRTLARVLMALAIIVTVAESRASTDRRLVIGVLALIAGLQAAIALLQFINGGPLGLDMLGEWQAPLITTGSTVRVVVPEGTMQHPHILASLALLAATAIVRQMIGARETAWSLAVLLSLAPAGITYARISLAGIGMACMVLARGALAGRPRYRLSLVLLAVGFGVPALLGLEGWTTRAGAPGGLADPSARDVLFRQAAALVAAHPLTGVGPGRELIALRELRDRDPAQVKIVQAVHAVPVTTAVEAGVAGGAVMGALLLVVGIRALRAGGATLALFAAYVPFVLLNHFPYTHQHGLVLTAVWLGLLDESWERPAS